MADIPNFILEQNNDNLSIAVLERSDNNKAEMLRFINCDSSILCAIANTLSSKKEVEFVGCKEVHPLEEKTDLTLRITDECEKSLDSVFIGALNTMNKNATDSSKWTLQGADDSPLIDECEMPDGINTVSAELVLHDATYAWANVIRKTLMSDLPVLAISKVVFRRNTSPMCDEILSHRLRMIPIRFNHGLIPRLNQRGVSFGLQVTVPETSSHTITPVFSSQIESATFDLEIGFSKKCTDKGERGFTITRMLPGQSLDLVASVNVGYGSQHARFASVSSVGFKQEGNNFHLEMEMAGQLRPSVAVKTVMQTLADRLSRIRTSFGTRAACVMKTHESRV